MSEKQQERIIELQRQVKVAREALERIKYAPNNAELLADLALENMRPLDPKQPLQGLVGHERRQRT